MATELAIHLSEQALSSLTAAAVAAGRSPAEQAAVVVEKVYASESAHAVEADAANRAFESCFGSVDMGRPVGIINTEIDADLVRGYDSAPGA